MERNYRIIEYPAVEVIMKDIIDKVKNVTYFPPIVIRGFLRQFNWQAEQFLEQFTEDYDNIFTKYDIFDSDVIATDVETESCEICFDNAYVAFPCRHHFCKSCLSSYLSLKIKDEIDCDVIKCPGFKCNFLLDDSLISQFVDADTNKIYQKRILQNFISRHPKLQNCPGTNCDFIIYLQDAKTPSPIVCLCGHEFCFHCDFETSHTPLPCTMIKEWTALLLRFGKTPASTEWIQKNTKPCPRCNRPILKHEGCDHMHCTQCGLDYSWSKVSTHQSKTPFFVPSEAPQVELKSQAKRQKFNDETRDNYDLQKIDTCTTKYVAALAAYREQVPLECESDMELRSAFKALKKCNHLLISSAILEFFTNDELLVFFMYHEYELQQRAMELEKAAKSKLKKIQQLKKWKRKKYEDEENTIDINDLLIKCRTEYDVLSKMVYEIAYDEGWGC